MRLKNTVSSLEKITLLDTQLTLISSVCNVYDIMAVEPECFQVIMCVGTLLPDVLFPLELGLLQSNFEH